MHLMIDLETLSTSPQAAILSIGAVLFDPLGPEPESPAYGLNEKHLYINVSLQTCLDVGLKVDGDTFYWWLKQSEAARKALCTDPVSLSMALVELQNFVRINTPERIWATEDFDLPILSNAYNAVGSSLPWRYWNDRGLRTLCETAFPDLKGKAPPSILPHSSGVVPHNALWDAYLQARAVQECYQQLKEHAL